jgi:anaerobic magnesium-protoporphyrin IX monomethyl ester cyclase
MKVLLVSAPSRRNSLVPPMGLLQVGALLEKSGHEPSIFDPLLDCPGSDKDTVASLDLIVDRLRPDVIGYGGVATSYGAAKRFALHVQRIYPKVIQMAGGPLASVYDLLLKKAGLDVIVHGEAEVSLPRLLGQIENNKAFEDVPGVSFLHRETEVVRNASPDQIADLDELPLPAYHLVDLPRYFRHMRTGVNLTRSMLASKKQLDETLGAIGEDDRWVEVMTGRGCTHRCLFCYRHMHGLRYFSIDYVTRHIQFLKSHYGIRGFQFADELFNGSVERVFALCDALEKNRLDIFYTVGGARVDRVNEAMLRRLKETGCVEIGYGHESGSDSILKEYRKGVTSRQNRDVTLLTTKEVGLHCPIQLVIGAPGETDRTIQETIDFLKEVDGYQYSLNYLIPLPETPIWKYVTEKGLVADVEEYLDLVAQHGGAPLVNLTSEPDKIWKSWRLKVRKEVDLHYLRKHGSRLQYLSRLLFHKIRLFLDPLISPKIAAAIGLLRQQVVRIGGG